MPDSRVAELPTSLQRERLNGKVASQIKELIFSNEMGMGQKLPAEKDLAGRLGGESRSREGRLLKVTGYEWFLSMSSVILQ
jgi:hypothetical protein